MLSPQGSYFMTVSLTNKWAKGDFFFFYFAVMDHYIFFFFL